MKKTIIAFWGTANVGKSMTIARIGRRLQEAGGETQANLNPNDYLAVFQYRKRIIGIHTRGDTEHQVQEGLDILINQNCSIIVIASKSSGATVNCITNFVRRNNYRLIWSTPYQVEENSNIIDLIKSYSAKHCLEMINDIISGDL